MLSANTVEAVSNVTEEKTNVLVGKQLATTEILGVVVVDGPHQANSSCCGQEGGDHKEPAPHDLRVSKQSSTLLLQEGKK